MQDACPPLPTDISPPLQDFLRQCFRKDAATRMTAKQLLSHKWIIVALARRQRANTPRAAGTPLDAHTPQSLNQHSYSDRCCLLYTRTKVLALLEQNAVRARL